MERWVAIDGYESGYEVSSEGRVRSLDRIVRSSQGRTRKHRGRILKPQFTGNGYLQVGLSDEGRTTLVMVHRLVAKHFLVEPSGFREVNHIDGNKLNNHASNLEWCTSLHNKMHALTRGLRATKLTHEQAVEVCEMDAAGVSQSAIAAKYGISQATVSRIVRRESWPYAPPRSVNLPANTVNE